MSRYSGPPTPFCVDRISTRKERIAKFREYFSTLPAQIEQDLKDFDEEAANDNEHFSELLQMWIVRMKSRFGADKAFTDEALEAGAIEDLLLPCLDHPNKYLAFYSMNALMAVVTNWKEARRRLMAQKNGWFKRLCALIRDGFIMEKNAATGLLFVIIQYAPWRYQFTPEERQEVVHGLKSLSLITAKQLIREAIDRDQPTFKRRGREVFPFDQQDYHPEFGSQPLVKKNAPEIVENLHEMSSDTMIMFMETEDTPPKDRIYVVRHDDAPEGVRTCDACHAPNPPKRCPCQQTRYCDQVCQKAHWKTHKISCSANKKK